MTGKKRLDQIDGLKLMFCMGIVLVHYFSMLGSGNSEQVPYWNILQLAYRFGYMGVEAFFLFSGFLMAYAYKEKIAKLSFVEFIKSRFKVLYPMTAASMLAGIMVCLVDGILFEYEITGKPVNLWYIFLSFTLTQTGWVEEVINPYGSATWFVCVLLLVYIIYFLICKITNNNEKYIACCVLMFFIGWICLKQKFHYPFLYESTGRGYTCFFLGVLIYELYISKNVNHNMISNLCLLILISVPVIAMVTHTNVIYVLGMSGGENECSCDFSCNTMDCFA